MNINNAATTDYFFPHCLCFILPSSHFQKGVVEGGSRLTKRWIKVCASAMFGPSLCCSPPTTPTLPSFLTLYANHLPAPCLVNLVSLHWFCVQQCHVFDISVFPVFGSRHCSDTCQNFVSSGRKVISYSFVSVDLTIPQLEVRTMSCSFT